MIENCYSRKELWLSEMMSHTSLDYYGDLIDPLREFLMSEGVNFYEQNMKGPTVADYLFERP